MYPWKTIVKIDKASGNPVYLQVVNAIIKEINQGRLKAGQKLPGTRMMSELLKINRKTTVIAYDELMAQGWLEIFPSKGAFVSESLPVVKYQKLPGSVNKNNHESDGGYEIKENREIQPLYIKKGKASIIEVTCGAPDDRLAPIDSLYKRCRAVATSRFGRKYRIYSHVEGEESLRGCLPAYLSETRGLSCTKDQIFITRGSQMAIFLIFQALIRTGDSVIVGDTNYPEADQAAAYAGGKIIRVPVDDKGICVSTVEQVCKQGGVKAMYITPHHHYPTTVTLSAERRVRLLALAEQYGFVILEDDYDYDFHYKSSPILPLASLDTKGMVLYIGGFTKLLAPMVRVGYLVAPQRLIPELNKIRQIVDRQGDMVMERAVAEMIEEGELQRHLKKVVKEYEKRRDLFCRLLREKLGETVSFDVPDGGMAIWLKFANHIDLKKVIDNAYEKELYLRVDKQYISSHNAFRMGFASLDCNEIEHVVDILHAEVQRFDKNKLH